MVKTEYENHQWTLGAKQDLQLEEPNDSSIPSITLKVLEPEDDGQKNWLIMLHTAGMVSLVVLLLLFRCIGLKCSSLIGLRYRRQ